ncbi:MAG TPA: FtsW/RodA/SpoVE family cell cycle protein, partial [Candidatus Paceibacterota bacterium]|nr:FtsW/RodA/SpoVE family cell cycle protein [Candidatus Paceibacterota bacterium]
GLLIFTSAALGLLARDGASFSSVTIKQLLVGLVLGGVVAYFVSRMDYRKWRAYTPHFFGFALFLTALTLIPHIGLSLKGASRWLVLGPVSFQPEEVLKLATIAMLAAYYAARMRQVPTLKGGIIPLLAIAGPAALILLLQPNTAGVAMLGATSIVVFFTAGGRPLHMGLLALLCALAIGAAALMYPHVSQRIETFLDQSSDPQGAGWQIQQSLIAVGSGGFFGRGFGQGIEKFSYLPEPIGDSIFAVAGEEFGFVGSLLLVGLFIALGLLGLRIAARASDPFGGLLVVGLVVLIVGQSFFNIASSLGLVPLVGVPLIFVSNGGTALAMAFVEAGVILSVSRRMRHQA